MYADKFRKQQRKVLIALTIISANRNAEKLTKNENEEKKANDNNSYPNSLPQSIFNTA